MRVGDLDGSSWRTLTNPRAIARGFVDFVRGSRERQRARARKTSEASLPVGEERRIPSAARDLSTADGWGGARPAVGGNERGRGRSPCYRPRIPDPVRRPERTGGVLPVVHPTSPNQQSPERLRPTRAVRGRSPVVNPESPTRTARGPSPAENPYAPFGSVQCPEGPVAESPRTSRHTQLVA